MGKNNDIVTSEKDDYILAEMSRNSDILTGNDNTLTVKQAEDILSSKQEIFDMIKSRCDIFQITYDQLTRNPVQELIRLGKCEDIYDEFCRIEYEQQQAIKDLEAAFTGLKSLAVRVNRILACVNLLPPEEYLILTDILLKKKKWEEVAADRQIGRSKIHRIKKAALEKICRLYNSEYTDSRLRKMSYVDVFSAQSRLPENANADHEDSNMDFPGSGQTVVHQMTIDEILAQ